MDIIYVIGFIVIFLLSVALVILLQLSKKTSNNAEQKIQKMKAKKKGVNYLLALYRMYRDTPFLRKYLIKIHNKVKLIYPADEFEIMKKTSEILLKGTLCAIGGIFLSIIISQGNIWFLCCGLLITYIVINSVTVNSFNNLEMKVLEQLRDGIASIRHKYHDTNDVISAINMALLDMPYEISLHMQNIYDILKSPKMNAEIDKYVSTAPNKYLLMFMSICASIIEYGDKKIGDGKSLFLTDLNHLKEQVNEEIIFTKKNAMAFMSLPTIALAPVATIKPIEAWMHSTLPDIAVYYKGIYGIVAMVSIFISSFVVHSLIISLRDKEQEIEKETDIFARLANNGMFSEILSKIIAKNYMKFEAYDNDLQSLGDHTGPKAFQLKRVVFGFVTIVATIIVLWGSNITQKITYIYDWTEAFSETLVPDEQYRNSMKEIGQEYSTAYSTSHMTEEELVDDIIQNTKIDSPEYAQIVAKEVMSRVDKYNNTYFKFYYLLIAFALGVIAYWYPVIMLVFKKSLIDMRKQEEVSQFQALMLILMHMNGTNVSEILEWMERFSYCFREDIAECRVNLSHGERKALEDLRDSQKHEPFREFVENLISIDRVGVEAAFDEISSDQEFNKEDRRIRNEELIIKRSSRANLIVYIPIAVTLGFYLIAPMVMFAFNMLTELMVEIS